jgi:[glutamine synthetase] adenylyltransferase / [glutamine synthetase]-adenylyl-L-tyrosine phosphorylase
MARKEDIQSALDSAWHRQTAEASLERWLQICDQGQWGDIPKNIAQLIAVFGASWYFTRFIFYRGRLSAELIDTPVLESFDDDTLIRFLSESLQADDQEHQFEWLRSLKNQAMLQILLRRLSAQDSLYENEAALTRLATATLAVAMKIVGLELERSDCQIAVLGMGRIAGFEMNYGSDLDLIFLYEDSSEEFRAFFSEKVRKLLRNMSLLAPTGVLYDIDMRLRPHGTSGALITSVASFLEYHQGQREIWERQMMTRCRPIIDYQELGYNSMQQISPHIYKESYDESLPTEILEVRLRVQDELGSRRGKIDVKRGQGGIMDIDFLTHYLQLKNGHRYPELQTSSTRTALTTLANCTFLPQQQAADLLDTYDFFKKVESCLRLFDMKSLNTFSSNLEDGNALIRAMTYRGEHAAEQFLKDYREKSAKVHSLFVNTLNETV